MILSVLVKPGSKTDSVEKLGEDLVVRTKARAVDGKANEAVVKLIAEYLGIPKTRVRIKRGLASRHKVIEIDT